MHAVRGGVHFLWMKTIRCPTPATTPNAIRATTWTWVKRGRSPECDTRKSRVSTSDTSETKLVELCADASCVCDVLLKLCGCGSRHSRNPARAAVDAYIPRLFLASGSRMRQYRVL